MMAMHTDNTFQPGGDEKPKPEPRPKPNLVQGIADLCESQAKLFDVPIAAVVVELKRRQRGREA